MMSNLSFSISHLLLLFLFAFHSFSQSDDPSSWSLSADLSFAAPPLSASALQDSLEHALGLLAIARADELVSSTSFWHRLLPRVQLGASLGLREIVFHDITGALMLPKDSYRVTASLALDDLLDGSRHALALLERDQACIRLALLAEHQTRAREAQRLKCLELDREIPAQRQRLALFASLLEYHEMLFVQGKIEYQTLLRSRHAVLTARKKLDDLEYARTQLTTRRKSNPESTPK